MKNRRVIYFFTAILGAAILGGCAKTPETSLVKQKGTASLGNYEEGDSISGVNEERESEDMPRGDGETVETEKDRAVPLDGEEGSRQGSNALRNALGAPETYQSELQDATGKFSVKINADVEIPDSDKVSAITVSQHPFDQEQIDLITDTFFSGGRVYDLEKMWEMTKDECLAKIEELKGYVAQGNLDPFGYGTDENGEFFFDLYQAIEEYERSYEEAPEEREMVEVTPGISYETVRDDEGNEWQDDTFYGLVQMPDSTEYVYRLQSYGSTPMAVCISKVCVSRKSGEKSYAFDKMWTDYDAIEYSAGKNSEEAGGWRGVPTREELEKQIGITLEEAQAMAEEKVRALGLDDMELTDWRYGVLGTDEETESGAPNIEAVDTGYILNYGRVLNGIPITYTSDLGGGLESMDSDRESWGYETLEFDITKDGIDSVIFYNRYDIGETKTENLRLLSFDEIMEIFEKMILVQSADALNYLESYGINIDRVTFGYTRIYEPAASSRSGILVPVWDFFGSNSQRYKEEDGTISEFVSPSGSISYITINAVDGSIIDRGLGY